MNPLRSRSILYTLVLAALFVGATKNYVRDQSPQIQAARFPTPPAPDESIATFISSTETDLMTGQFDRLEHEAQIDRNVGNRFAGGYSKLRYFYRSLGSFGRYDNCGCGKTMYYTDVTFGEKLHAIRQWMTQKPGSAAAAIANAELWTSLAWNARGHDFIDETSPQSVDLFRKRLSIAATYLGALDVKADPAIYDVKLSLLRGIGDGRTDLATLYSQAVQAFPAYYFYYGAMAGLLEPRWFGAPGELQNYLNRLGSSAGEDGIAIYSFVAEALLADYTWNDLFSATDLDWPTLKRSLDVREHRYGTSIKLLNVELKLAAAAHDQTFASRLVQRVGTKWDPNVWRDWKSFTAVEDWASSPHGI